jgi:hypothetical protein
VCKGYLAFHVHFSKNCLDSMKKKWKYTFHRNPGFKDASFPGGGSLPLWNHPSKKQK